MPLEAGRRLISEAKAINSRGPSSEVCSSLERDGQMSLASGALQERVPPSSHLRGRLRWGCCQWGWLETCPSVYVDQKDIPGASMV